jgi:hypothetical protein
MHRTAMVYRLNIFGKMRLCFLAFLSVGTGIFLFSIIPNHFPEVWLKLLPVAMVLSGIYFAMFAFRYCVIADAESVAVIGPFLERSLKRNEVSGRRRIMHLGNGYLDYDLLVAKNPREKSLMILGDIAFNKEWEHWYLHLPNLNSPNKPTIYFKKIGQHRQKRIQK